MCAEKYPSLVVSTVRVYVCVAYHKCAEVGPNQCFRVSFLSDYWNLSIQYSRRQFISYKWSAIWNILQNTAIQNTYLKK